jgi:hypothetical protein
VFYIPVGSVPVRAPATPAATPRFDDDTDMEKQAFELQKRIREAQKALRFEETSKVEAEPTSEPAGRRNARS